MLWVAGYGRDFSKIGRHVTFGKFPVKQRFNSFFFPFFFYSLLSVTSLSLMLNPCLFPSVCLSLF